VSAQGKPSIVFCHGIWAHVPMLSQPDVVVDVIRTAANAVQSTEAAAAV